MILFSTGASNYRMKDKPYE